MLAADAHRLDLDCGISYARISSWLDGELALPREAGCWVFSVDSQTCSIELEPLEDHVLGAVRLERTRLTAQGDSVALASFDKLFTLRFMSAGG